MNKKTLIVGSGRLATHFTHYFKELGLDFLNWNRQSKTSFSEYAKLHSNQISAVYLLISDAQIENFYSRHKDLLSCPWVHASGALQIKGMLDLHPPMTFSASLYSASFYKKIPLVSTSGRVFFEETFLDSLENKFYQINSQDKALYHSLLVLGVSATNVLWESIERVFSKMDLPPEFVHAYKSKIFENNLQQGIAAMTGPWVRNDAQTIASNKLALENTGLSDLYSDLLGIYERTSN